MNRYINELPASVQEQARYSMIRAGMNPEDIERAMNSRLCDLIHEYDEDALVQVCDAVLVDGIWELDESEGAAFIEDIDGREALREIRLYTSEGGGLLPIFVDGESMGYQTNARGGFGIILTDCDEESYSEYYGEPYDG